MTVREFCLLLSLALACPCKGTWAAGRNLLKDGSFVGLRHFRGLETWRLTAGDMEVRKHGDAPDGYLLRLKEGAAIGQRLTVPEGKEFRYTCVLQARSAKGAKVAVSLVPSPPSNPRAAKIHREKHDSEFTDAGPLSGSVALEVEPGKRVSRLSAVLEGKFERRPRWFAFRLKVDDGEIEVGRVVLAEGTSEHPVSMQTSLRAVNGKGNREYVLLAWEQTAGTYAADKIALDYREKGTAEWSPVPGLRRAGPRAAVVTACEEGKTYEFRCLGEAPGKEKEEKSVPDATVALGTPRQEITFGVNPYPLADMFGDPTPDQPLWLIRDEIGWIELCLYDQDQGRVKKREGTWGDVVLEAPEGLSIVGANYTANRFYPPGHPVEVRPAGACTVAGGERNIYVIQLSNPKVPARSRAYSAPLDVYFDAGETFEGGRLSWWCVRDGQAGPRTEVSVNVLPAIEFAGDSPLRHWLAFSDALTGDLTRGQMPREPSEILIRRTRLFAKIGVTEDYSVRDGWPEAADWAASQPGIKVCASKRSQLTGKILAGYYYRSKPHPREKLEELVGGPDQLQAALWKDAQGRTVYDKHEADLKYRGNWNYWCNEYLIGADIDFYRNVLEIEREYCPEEARKEMAEAGVEFTTVWDNEMDLGEKVLDHCFCERCVASFSKRTNVPRDGLTPDKILKDHHVEWRRFRNWQMGEVVGMWNRMNKELDPRLKSCLMFSGNEHHENIDIEDVNPYVDEFLVELTCSGHFYFDALKEFMSKARKPVTGFSMECTPNGRILPETMYVNMMTSAALGCTGFMHERIGQICGKRIALCVRANQEAKTLWPYFREGKRADDEIRLKVLPLTRDRVYVGDRILETDLSSPRSRLRCLTHRKGREFLIDLFNFGRARPLFVQVSVPRLERGPYRVVDPVSGVVLTRAERGKGAEAWSPEDLTKGFVWKVGAQDVSFVLITPERVRKRVAQSDSYWRSEWERTARRGREFPSIASDGVRIGWEDVESDHSYEVRVETPVQAVSISLAEGGQVWRWEIGEEKRTPLHLDTFRKLFGKYGRTFGMDRFAHWGWGRGQVGAYELLSRRIVDSEAVIVLRAGLEHLTGRMRLAELRKTYRVSSKSPTIRIEVEIRNHDEKPLNFRYNAPTIPYLAKPENDKLPRGRWEWVQVKGVDCGPDSIAGGIFAPITGEGVVMRIPKGEKSMLYLGGGATPPVLEWFGPKLELPCEETWRVEYDLVYLRKTTAEMMVPDAAKLLGL